MISFSVCLFKNNQYVFLLRPSIFEYFADPFILATRGDTVCVLMEVYRRLHRKGDICLLEVDFQRKTYCIKPLITEGHHLSYPCVIRKGVVDYVMPESEAASVQYLYRLEWGQQSLRAHKTSALQGRYVDLTIHEEPNGTDVAQFYNGTTNSNGYLLETDLLLDGSDEIRLGQAIKVKGRRRPGGRLHGDVQPFQRTDVEYGSGLDFVDASGEVVLPERLGFPELVCALQHQMHHLNQYDNLMVFDVKERVVPRVMRKGFFATANKVQESLEQPFKLCRRV